MKLKNKSNIKQFAQSLDFIDVEIAATHLDYINGNYFLYRKSAAQTGVKSWHSPFNKPQLVNHDKTRDPLGRITNAVVMSDAAGDNEPPDYVKLTVRLSDTDAIEKVLKGLYNTVSVGSKTTRVRCSECNQVLTEDGLCEHEKGSLGDNGDPVYWIIDEIEYKEDSFVNMPADPYSKIVRINIGNGWLLYKDFLENQDALISELMMEDNLMIIKDAKLSTAARKKLPDSAFCGPGRSFPAHDEAHVRAGLRLLNRSDYSDATKAKIKACLYRKGKKYGITPSDEEYEATPNILTYRIGEDFTDEEVKTITDFFNEKPDALYELEDEEDSSMSEKEKDEDDKKKKKKKKDGESDDSSTEASETEDAKKKKKKKKDDPDGDDDADIKKYNKNSFASGGGGNDEETEDAAADLKKGMVELLSNPGIDNSKFGEFIKDQGIEDDVAMQTLITFANSFLSQGKSKEEDATDSFDEEELKMGVKVELEHTTDEVIAEKITKDHLAEISDYYTRLAKMEKAAGVESEYEDQVKQLNDRVSELETILNTKEDEISQLVDELAISNEEKRNALIDHIVNVKKIRENLDDEALDEIKEKYNKRRINSLVDTINDLQTEIGVTGLEDDRIEDPTTNNGNVDTGADLKDDLEIPNGVDPKFAPFYAKHRETE